jgi:hypothetical protein
VRKTRSPSSSQKGERILTGGSSTGEPMFADSERGQAQRLAYYEARKLDRLPDSLLDYHDVLRGRETPAECRARERRASGR